MYTDMKILVVGIFNRLIATGQRNNAPFTAYNISNQNIRRVCVIAHLRCDITGLGLYKNVTK